MPCRGIEVDFAGLVLPAHPTGIRAPDRTFPKSSERSIASSTLAGSQSQFAVPALPRAPNTRPSRAGEPYRT